MVAFAAAVLDLFLTGRPHAVVSVIFYLALIVWACLEISSGANWFRRGLGIAVLAYILITQVLRH